MDLPPRELNSPVNQAVLKYLRGKSAHSDVAEALLAALKPLGDVQTFCPNPHEYRYLAAHTRNVVFAFCVGMNTVAFRLAGLMQNRACASGGVANPECGEDWISFTLFRSDWPKVDLEFWARKAYQAARAL